MTTSSSGAVFFLGTRAHYQVLQPPESQYDVENGNASTETIYQNPSVREIWTKDTQAIDRDSSANYIGGERGWGYCDNDVTEEKDTFEIGTGMKRRTKRRQSEIALCERDAEMKPALLNNIGNSDPPKSKPFPRRISLLTFLTSLSRRKRRLDTDQIQYLQHLESALNSCTYRESCRCLECQSSYFDCDESEDYSSDESEYSPRYISPPATREEPPSEDEDDDDEVFVDTVPGDNTSTDLLIEGREKMSISSDEVDVDEGALEIEVAAGTPVLLNYLLTHPITCAVQ